MPGTRAAGRNAKHKSRTDRNECQALEAEQAEMNTVKADLQSLNGRPRDRRNIPGDG